MWKLCRKIDFFSYTLFLYTSATYYQKGFIYPTVQKHEDSTFFSYAHWFKNKVKKQKQKNMKIK